MPLPRLLLQALAAAAAVVASALCALPASGLIQRSAVHFARCPRVAKKDGKEVETDRNARATEATVPMPPSAVQLCRYYGYGAGLQTPQTQARIGRLRSEHILKKSGPVRSVAREFDSLAEVPEGPIYCPADEGARLYAVFAYADGAEPGVPVEVHLSGCSFVWNGRTQHVFWATPKLIHRLKLLTSGNS